MFKIMKTSKFSPNLPILNSGFVFAFEPLDFSHQFPHFLISLQLRHFLIQILKPENNWKNTKLADQAPLNMLNISIKIKNSKGSQLKN